MAINDDIDKAKKALSDIDKKAVPQAMARTINNVAAKVMVRAVIDTSKKVDVPKRLIKGRAKLERAKPKRLSAFIRVNRGNLPVIRLVTGAGRFVRKGKNKGQLKVRNRFYPRAFIQKLQNGRVQVLQRQGKDRYPIDVVKIPLKNPLTEAFNAEVKRAYQEEMPKELRNQLIRQIQIVVKK
ncbi:phage tail protein [Aggregatibacter actinomycetemcomitans]|uniref:phage tail protein n=1 Tax=Aggregatibacter actinomycetemcomitans TaxID=714 RepID=UPI002151505E|nr:phage tail protein [Aggregatibacter actinomycetemcomitans]